MRFVPLKIRYLLFKIREERTLARRRKHVWTSPPKHVDSNMFWNLTPVYERADDYGGAGVIHLSRIGERMPGCVPIFPAPCVGMFLCGCERHIISIVESDESATLSVRELRPTLPPLRRLKSLFRRVWAVFDGQFNLSTTMDA